MGASVAAALKYLVGQTIGYVLLVGLFVVGLVITGLSISGLVEWLRTRMARGPAEQRTRTRRRRRAARPRRFLSMTPRSSSREAKPSVAGAPGAANGQRAGATKRMGGESATRRARR